MQRSCDNCGKVYKADMRNVNRGWGLCCSKSCAASKREKSKPNYDPNRVAINNIKRELYKHDENYYGKYTGKRTSEGYKIYGRTACDEFGEPVYEVDEYDDTHPFSEDAFN